MSGDRFVDDVSPTTRLNLPKMRSSSIERFGATDLAVAGRAEPVTAVAGAPVGGPNQDGERHRSAVGRPEPVSNAGPGLRGGLECGVHPPFPGGLRRLDATRTRRMAHPLAPRRRSSSQWMWPPAIPERFTLLRTAGSQEYSYVLRVTLGNGTIR